MDTTPRAPDGTRRTPGSVAARAGPLPAVLLAAGALVVAAALAAGPNRYGHSDRVERHMLPPVTTGPMDPDWSPDGRWIAFSMRGDIWKVPAGGGEAVALTEGPDYHFEPRWSPDGTRIALTVDVDGNLDVGVVPADGGAVRRVTTDPEVDVEPEWSADGRWLFFASARGRGFGIYRAPVAQGDGGAPSPDPQRIVDGFQPALSPDGTRLAYVAPVRGRPGSGGLWTVELDGTLQPELVRYEETEYRTKPAWSLDGRDLVYVSDERGSNDLVRIPAGGGSPILLTPDSMGEMSPAPSPDGRRIAFVSNHDGPTRLYTVGADGGRRSAWRTVEIRGRTPRRATGTVRVRVLGPGGEPVPARIHVEAADGRGYAPEGGFHRVISVSETHYFHTDGEFELEAPVGDLVLEALRGHEYGPARVAVEVPPRGTADVEMRLRRIVDLPAEGWYSGDTHVHDLHQGRFGLDHEAFFLQLQAEDLHVSNALIHMDGTRLMGRWDDLTGRPHPLSTSTHLLQYGQEFRGSLGHVALLGVSEFVLPFLGGAAGTPYEPTVLDLPWLDGADRQGGLGGFVHPFLNAVETPRDAAASLIALDVALGRGAFYDIAAVYSDEVASTDFYYRLLNAGFRLPATGGTDNFSDVWRDPPPGAARTYARVEGPLSFGGWLDAVRSMRTFGSTGPILLLEVEGRGPGEEIRLEPGAPETLRARVRLHSIAPVDSVAIVVNGEVAASLRPEDAERAVLEADVAVPEGGWIAARARGPTSRVVTDSYAFAQTTPVWVVRGGRRWSSGADRRFLAESIEAIWARVEDGPWAAEAAKARFREAVEEALAALAPR